MEVQLTDFENAAYSIFIVLLTRAILSYGLVFYLPISKVCINYCRWTYIVLIKLYHQVDENMKTAQKRDAVNVGKFYFRKSVFSKGNFWPIIRSR